MHSPMAALPEAEVSVAQSGAKILSNVALVYEIFRSAISESSALVHCKRFFIIDTRTMAEIAGLALAALPVLMSAASQYNNYQVHSVVIKSSQKKPESTLSSLKFKERFSTMNVVTCLRKLWTTRRLLLCWNQ